MCEEHDDHPKCEEHLDKLDGTGVFKAMLRGEVFNDDFKREVLKDAVSSSKMDPEDKAEALGYLDEAENTHEEPDSGVLKPLSLKKAVKDSYNILRGRPF
jgi:hypothetical protein